MQGGKKKAPLGTLQHWKPKTEPTLIPSEKKSVKQKVFSRDCCRGLKDCDWGATAVKSALALPTSAECLDVHGDQPRWEGITSPKPSADILLLLFVSGNGNRSVFSSVPGTSPLLFLL